ncbi:hypothetical protein C9374_008068 [Naegleria lovaniensis]|uniref:Uncharacterized protein n=1 Tax=Naegleria lovaniensis TaxID=51637 RepID=A0AA88GFJ3_NAELO|nr:uncharacterized protein C9374_008068 [Naegleria lovaniensis]KAG2378429.1 hypothetical protein C9374_008068 [Naegleria lovaniensis]
MHTPQQQFQQYNMQSNTQPQVFASQQPTTANMMMEVNNPNASLLNNPSQMSNPNQQQVSYPNVATAGVCYNPYDTYFDHQVQSTTTINKLFQIESGLTPLPPKKVSQIQPQQPPVSTFTTTTTTVTSQQHDLLAAIQIPPPSLEQANHLAQLEQDAKKWLQHRLQVIEMLQALVNDLNKVATKTTKTKIGGTASNIIGAGLLVGGVIAAPFTLGGSLLASTAGLGLVGAGTAVTVGSSIVEWKHAKKMAKLTQIELEKDTKEMNEMLRKIFEYRSIDTYMEYRVLNFENSKVTVMQFVNALVGNGAGNAVGCIGSGKLTHGSAGATSLASLLIKGAIPIVSIPVDIALLVQESKRLHGKEPSKLASKIVPVIDSLKLQTQLATGQ